MKVSVVIPAHNADATLAECLAACAHQTHQDVEIIVVDDGSKDGTSAIAHSYRVNLLVQPNRGPAAARNAGAAAANGEVIAFTDADCVPHEDWIDRLIAPLDDTVAAVGGAYGTANPKSALARFVHAEILSRYANYRDTIDFAGSYNVAIRRHVFDEIEGFDTDFKTSSAEDNDLCYRLADAGYAIAFARDAVVDHHHPTYVWKYLRTQMRHGYWRMKLYAKHPGRKSGDHYASGVELWAPVYAVASLAALLLSGIFTRNTGLIGVALVFVLLLYAYRFVTAARIARFGRDISIPFAAMVLFSRDVARGIGLIGGSWRFLVLRKTTA